MGEMDKLNFIYTVSYKITLPTDLPPSHRGKTIRFNYYLVIAVQKPPSVQAGKPTLPPQSQLVHIRFRVLNHVSGKEMDLYR
jgi:hypothetical protein